MAGDSDSSKAADKGKGKAVDGQKPEESKKGKDENPAVNGKKEDEKLEGSSPNDLSLPQYLL